MTTEEMLRSEMQQWLDLPGTAYTPGQCQNCYLDDQRCQCDDEQDIFTPMETEYGFDERKRLTSVVFHVSTGGPDIWVMIRRDRIIVSGIWGWEHLAMQARTDVHHERAIEWHEDFARYI